VSTTSAQAAAPAEAQQVPAQSAAARPPQREFGFER
jgi:hypothetical protein